MKFQHILWLLITIAIVPVGVNLILLCPTPLSIPVLGQPVEWISFWGNYASNIVYIVVTIYVLISTQKQTKIQMVTQIKSVQLQTRLENLRNQLIGNYKMFDLQSLSIAANYLRYGNYKDTVEILLKMNSNMEMQSNASCLYFSLENPSDEEVIYNDCIQEIMIPYGCLVNDLIFVLPIIEAEMREVPMSPQEIVDYTKQQYDYLMSNLVYDLKTRQYYEEGNSVLSKILNLEVNDDFSIVFNDILNKRLLDSVSIHSKKYKLIACTEQLLKSEERKMSKLLEG